MAQMVVLAERRSGATAQQLRQVNWRGRSGQCYALQPMRFDSFALLGEGLFLLALGSAPLWVGTAADVIGDADNRSRFRLALDCADRVFSLETRADEAGRMAMVWDLEGAEPLSGLNAA
jgi:hypothetical protein